jgi:hypothetical protein
MNLAEVTMGLIGKAVEPAVLAAKTIKPVAVDDIDFPGAKLEQQVTNDPRIPETERAALIRARKGRGCSRIGSRGRESPVGIAVETA